MESDWKTDRTLQTKNKGREALPAIVQASGNASDAEGSAVGDFIGLKAPERKRKAGRPTNSRDKQKARNSSNEQLHRMSASAAQANGFACAVYAENHDTRAPHIHREIFPRRRGNRQNAQTVESVGTGELATT